MTPKVTPTRVNQPTTAQRPLQPRQMPRPYSRNVAPSRPVNTPPAKPTRAALPPARQGSARQPSLPMRTRPRKQTNWLLIGLIAAPLMFIAVVGLIVVTGAIFIFGG